MNNASKSTEHVHDPAPVCSRCGTCCRKGGPALHSADKPIIESGLIQAGFLYTIRMGEWAHDNVKGRIFPAPTDIVKIKSRKNAGACIFFNEQDNACTVYAHRPLECQVLSCRDTRQIEAIYAEDRLTRKSLIGGIRGLWDLVEAHQERCDYGKVITLVKALSGDTAKEISKRLLEMIRFDLHIRDLAVEKGGIHADMGDFLFGRTLFETVKVFGVRLKMDGKGG